MRFWLLSRSMVPSFADRSFLTAVQFLNCFFQEIESSSHAVIALRRTGSSLQHPQKRQGSVENYAEIAYVFGHVPKHGSQTHFQ